MYFSHAFRKTLLGAATTTGGSTLSVATSTATKDLTAGTLGLYDSGYNAVTYAAAASAKPFYIVQGSYYKQTGYSDIIGAHGGYQESVKSKMINPKYISRIFWVAGKAPVQQVVQIPLKDAAGGLTNVGLNADTTYRLRIDVKGSPALRFLSHNIYRNVDSYTGPANATTPSLLKDPVATLVDWKEQLTMSPYFNQLVQARAYALKTTNTTASVDAFVTSTYAIYAPSSFTGIYVGQRVVSAATTTTVPANSFVTSITSATNISLTATIGAGGTASTTSYVVTSGNTLSGTGTAVVGCIVSGGGLPSGSYISAYSSTTSYTISYPTQSSAPSLSGTITVQSSVTISYPTQSTLPTASDFNNKSFKYYNDLYGNNGGYTVPYTNIAMTSGQLPSYQGQTPYIPGTGAYSTSTNAYPGLAQSSTPTLPTGTTIAAASKVTDATSGAHIYTASPDASTFTTDAFLELTAAYLETKFGNPTFTVTDNYDLEPLKIIASLMDDSGSTVVTAPIGTAATQAIGIAGIATEVQTAQQAQGTGETVLRELILTGKYRQEAFTDSDNSVNQIRMREAEANPSVLNMMTVANRNGLYNKLCILHNVPRFNNPTTTFDNDQYLIEIAFPNTIGLSSLFNNASTTANGTRLATITNSGSSLFGDYIAAAANVANGASGGTISNASAIIPVEIIK